MPSYAKNSHDIALLLNSFNEIDENMFLFTKNDTSMCPNINTEEGLTFLTIDIDNLIFKVKPDWPRKETITVLKSLLRFNVFQFGDAYYGKK